MIIKLKTFTKDEKLRKRHVSDVYIYIYIIQFMRKTNNQIKKHSLLCGCNKHLNDLLGKDYDI